MLQFSQITFVFTFTFEFADLSLFKKIQYSFHLSVHPFVCSVRILVCWLVISAEPLDEVVHTCPEV